ncbi:tRNA A-37 threonylcarbamoyl transferase component Bud32 [Pseudomonas nitritireducens]|uniref:tRNA A-37 threonylcarbamoyl transferase component Bud32 n=1 Tax=Pseudomonas nitroreducens TaxID=46680 RepID=A0A7W7KP71_PSENT|nr:phosphotransferase [Pseudomonas nitritireducens]MBB4866131.1 tRNA A-37 threonylcarbamoyl transferase component Bud32 [Pseudomonas nitritireducens]
MNALDDSTYLSLVDGAQVIERDPHGDKVLQLRDGSFLKLFRRKRLLSTALLSPPEKRFQNNCEALAAKGIPCPQPLRTYHFPEIERTAVRYQPLPGHTLRSYIPTQEAERQLAMLRELAAFIARLHDLGIYFRSLHLGNVILTPSGEYGLIDLSDLRTRSAPLSRALRKRNFKHLLRYKKDLALIRKLGLAAFFELYNKNATTPLDSHDLIAEYDGSRA